MKKRILAFGCSHTSGYGCIGTHPYYLKYKSLNNKIWINHIASEMGLPVLNFAKEGASNDFIIDSIINEWNNISCDDIIFINFTYSHRFDIPIFNKDEKEFMTITMNIENKNMKKLLNEQFTKEQLNNIEFFLYNFSFDNLIKKRQLLRIDYICERLKEKGCSVIFWDAESELKNLERISQHTLNKIEDLHLSFNGHKELAERFLKKYDTILISDNKSLI
jgi:hypothetical protein